MIDDAPVTIMHELARGKGSSQWKTLINQPEWGRDTRKLQAAAENWKKECNQLVRRELGLQNEICMSLNKVLLCTSKGEVLT